MNEITAKAFPDGKSDVAINETQFPVHGRPSEQVHIQFELPDQGLQKDVLSMIKYSVRDHLDDIPPLSLFPFSMNKH
jgi:hypothetical protein